ncbi:hypothetical protein QJ854_gp736 [Moumouvirus goulette]|uniref:Repeat protein n=1 Tax=Moumouvirus goulette TaxID=1247379 RepID=M1PM87_9VIRU|nr:hypothetical protein QJ854_gp736 [Moumouvirus goulette]AGF85046.1 hypothetical protein glt_00237 [Moumouvirus goulette]
MASYRHIDFKKEAILSGNLPYPYYYPYVSATPSLTGQSHRDDGINYNYEASFNVETGECHNPSHDQSNNLFHSPYLDLQKYHYYNYDTINVQDPSCVLNLDVKTLVSTSINNEIDTNNIKNNIIPKDVELVHYVDPILNNPWGLTIVGDTIWVGNNGGINLYNLLGKPLNKTIGVFGSMGNTTFVTGIAQNNDNCAFLIYNGSQSGSSSVIMVTRDGTINAYNPTISEKNTILVIDNSLENCVYTGVAIYKDVIYIADFYNQKIDVYNRFFERIFLPFVDECLDQIPLDFAPYNISVIGDLIYVTYARQNPVDNQCELNDYGYGYINIFTPQGIFIRRFASRGTLNSPWGIIEAPSRFGYPAGSVFISNYGSGFINVFDSYGKFLGNLKTNSGVEINIIGIRGMTFYKNLPKSIYWTATDNTKIDDFIGHIGVINITNK